MLGQNTVSGSNISLGVSGPFTIGGGDVISLQIGITNQNNVAIESATLVVEYPPGTRSGDDENKELFSERIALDSGIAPGDTYNFPIKARVFGEENQESSIKVSVEYRVTGSSATFYKEAAPHRFKIGSAPVVMKIDSEGTISSGQETTITLTVTSNSSSPINNLIVQADYPSGFEFTESSPATVSGRNVWSIPELKPEESASIEIKGIVIGTESEKYVVKFTTGVSDGRTNELASVLAVADTEFTLEEPFLAIDVRVANSSDQTVTIAPGEQATVSLNLRNSLDTTVYDGLVEVQLSGNALSNTDVSVNNGYYDANAKIVRFNVSEVSALREIDPDSTVNLSFSLRPEATGIETPQIKLNVSASARRVSAGSAREQIADTISRTIKLESRPTVSQEVLGAESGPVPPRAGETTKYAIRWQLENSANSISGAVVTATLPSYVEWTGETSGSGAWSYNPSTRTVEWRAGSVNAGGGVSGDFNVNFLPSASLAGRTPTLVEAAHMRSDDNFTGSVLRFSSQAITTEISGDRNSGVVQN
ncbi:DUF11 domain-containing protein [Candidatus Nomurabacteria bacterium]|nr:DUF11 domain-containing protein [Candidatus Nomurabacteria bacterium]